MENASCQWSSRPSVPRTIIIKEFVDAVNTLWLQLKRDIERRNWKIAKVTVVEIGCESDGDNSGLEGSSLNEGAAEELRCTVKDVKNFELLQPSLSGTIAVLCSNNASGESLRILARREAFCNDGEAWSWGHWNGLIGKELIIESYTVRWRGAEAQSNRSHSSAPIIEAGSFYVRDPAISPEPCTQFDDLDTVLPDGEGQSSLVVTAMPNAGDIGGGLPRRKTLVELLAPIGCTPGPTQSSAENEDSEPSSTSPPRSSASLGKGLEESSSAHQSISRTSISTPFPLASRSMNASKFPGPQLLSRAQRQYDKPIIVDDSPRKAAPPVQYREARRQKRAREVLPAFDCELCREWHEGVEKCFPNIISDVSIKDTCQCKARKRPSIGMISRHRYMSAPSSTPSGYWDVKFPPTQQ